MRIVLAVVAAAVLCAGCQVTDYRPETYVTPGLNAHPDKFVLLNAGKYQGELTLQLAKQGFQVKPIAIEGSVASALDDRTVVQYREAGYRYGLRVDTVGVPGKICAFSGAAFVDATVTVIDIANNDTVAVIKQSGPAGDCPPLTPVWPLLAKDLADTLQPGKP